MKIKKAISLGILVFTFFANANAYNLKGIVVNAATNKPLSGVYIYINQSEKLAITQADGTFELQNVTAPEADIIATQKGFETLQYHVQYQKNPSLLKFEMQPIENKRWLNWVGNNTEKGKEWFQLFQNFYMGHSVNAAQCEMLNANVLHFNWDDSTQILNVATDGPLLVSNEALGYLLIMNFESFKMNKNGDLLYDVSMGFKPLHSSNPSILYKWKNNRIQNFATSQVSFWYSLYADSLKQNGFTVQFIQRIFEGEPGYVNAIANKKNTTGIQSVKAGNAIVKKKFVDLLLSGKENNLTTYLKKVNDFTTSLTAPQVILQVKYRRVDAWGLNEQTNGFNPFLGNQAESYSYIIFSNNPIYITKNGYAYPGNDFWVTGDWNWMGLSTAMPYDAAL